MVTKSGFHIFVHHGAEYVTKSTPIISLLPGYDNFIRVRPQFNIPSQHFLSLPFESRRCLLPHDRNLTLFRQSRCHITEFGSAIYKECGCHPYFFPQFEDAKNTTENCTVHALQCFKFDSGESEWKLISKQFFTCVCVNLAFWNQVSTECFPSCYDLFYRLTTSQTMLQNRTTIMTI